MINVEKNLIIENDIALGTGTVVQTRNGVTQTEDKLDLIKSVSTYADLASVDTTKFRSAFVLDNTNAGGLYTYNTVTTTWEKSVTGGQYLGTNETKAIAYLSQTTDENLVVPAGMNAYSVDSITVENGGSITQENGSVYKVM